MFLTMLSTCLLLLMAPFSMGSNDWPSYMNNHLDVDNSAVKACWLHQGTLEYVDLQNTEKGSICSYTTNFWTHDNRQALEYCESRHPYPIVSAEKIGSQTKCAFQISLECDPNWYQANGKCYKVIKASANWRAAETVCSRLKPRSMNPRVTDYYSDSLSLDFSHLEFSEAWVSVPSLHDYFVNFGDMNRADEDSEAALFVLDGAYKYDIKPGTIILADPSEEHNVLCEYTPPITIAEMYRLAEKYNEIYPFHVSGKQVVFATSSYMTVKHQYPRFTTDPIKDMCMKVSKILNVRSYPLSSYSTEFNPVKPKLKNHRFYLSAAEKKSSGCSRMDFIDNGTPSYLGENVQNAETGYCDAYSLSLSQYNRHPTMAAMRAPAICNLRQVKYEVGTCPSGWVPFVRAGGKTFCHYVDGERKYTIHTAKQFCVDQGAALSGFESQEEIKTVYDAKIRGKGFFELLLGGRTPCKTGCKNETYLAEWDEGVSRNNEFLNTQYRGSYWKRESLQDYVSLFYADLHIHHGDYCGVTFKFGWGLICGKYADVREVASTSTQLG